MYRKEKINLYYASIIVAIIALIGAFVSLIAKATDITLMFDMVCAISWIGAFVAANTFKDEVSYRKAWRTLALIIISTGFEVAIFVVTQIHMLRVQEGRLAALPVVAIVFGVTIAWVMTKIERYRRTS